jgi:GT2 family glycosyltransferase
VPTAIVQVDLEQNPESIEIQQPYTRALIVVRRRGAPVGQFYVPVHDGRVPMDRYASGLRTAIRKASWNWRVEDYLGPEPRAAVPPATVAICTRERPDDLQRALHAVTTLDPPPFEILVVDNNPTTGRTREVAGRFAGVRYVREDRPGLDAARNRALAEATTALVAFTDDDAVPERDWLAHLVAPFEDPRVWCTSGLTLPLELETPAQEWFEKYNPFGRGFLRQLFDGTKHDPLEVSRVGAGANMALRREVASELGGFDVALDAGTPTMSGGDHEMFVRILAAGHRIVYEPRAVSWHRHRRTWDELRHALYGYGTGVYAMWTRQLLLEGEPAVLKHAVRWLWYGQLRRLVRTLRGSPDGVPFDLLTAEWRGCLTGPWAYLRSRYRARRWRRA